MSENNKSMLDGWKDIVAGIVGGIALVCAGHPLDTIKVRLQTQGKIDGKPQFSGAMDCAIKTVQREGIRGLYKGMISPIVGVPPIYAIVFGAYGTSKKILTPQDAKPGDLLSIPRIYLAGCMTGVATTVVTVPVELVKARLQIQYNRPSGTPPLYKGPLDCANKVFKKEGLRGLFRGTVATLWRDVPGTGFYFAGYEISRRMFLKEGQSVAELPVYATLFAGGMGGIFNWITVFPLDVIKSRLQTAETGRYKAGTQGMIQCANELIRENGVRSLYKGLTPALVRSFPANACCFVAFELAMKVLNRIA